MHSISLLHLLRVIKTLVNIGTSQVDAVCLALLMPMSEGEITYN